MSRVVGIDVTATHVRAALLRVAYRKTVVEDLREVHVAEFASPAAAITGVMPKTFAACTFAPCASSSFTASSSLAFAATCSAVAPGLTTSTSGLPSVKPRSPGSLRSGG